MMYKTCQLKQSKRNKTLSVGEDDWGTLPGNWQEKSFLYLTRPI